MNPTRCARFLAWCVLPLMLACGLALHVRSLRAAEPAGDLELLKTFRQEFIEVTPGQGKFPAEFTMGRASGPAEEQPPRTVKLTKPFAIARYEVPQNLWQAVMGSN